MPTDILLTWNKSAQACAMTFSGNDLVSSLSLVTAAYISLLADARAAADDTLPDPRVSDRRGWWGDSTNTDKPGDSVGSRLWLLGRSKNVNDTIKKAKTYVEEALAWMVGEGAAKSVSAIVEAQPVGIVGTMMLAFRVDIVEPDGTVHAFKFEQEWRATANAI